MGVKLNCDQVAFSYGGRNILHQITFCVGEGEFCAILGRNGSGKTTLLHCLNRILAVSSGKISIDNNSIYHMTQLELARKVCLVPQEHQDIFPFNVLDVVVMGRTPYLGFASAPSYEDYSIARSYLAELHADHLIQQNFNEISGGERQIVLLARALTQQADIMILDEPTNHLDFNNTFKLLGQVRNLCKDLNISIIASMHDPNLAAIYADNIVMIKDGTITIQGDKEAVLTEDNLSLLYETQVKKYLSDGESCYYLPSYF